MTREEIISFVKLAADWANQGKLRDAEAICKIVIRSHPLNPETLHQLGLIAYRGGDKKKAIEWLRRAIKVSPREPAFHNAIGIALSDIRQAEVAVRAFKRAIELRSDFVEAHANLGTALAHLKRFDEAEASLRHALHLNPTYSEAHGNLGNILRSQGRLNDALAQYDEAIRRNPRCREGYAGRAMVQREFGDPDGAVLSYRQSLAITPRDAVTHSNLLYAMHYQPDVTPEEVFAEHRVWEQRHAEPLYREINKFSNIADPDRRLRVGYISADFREHPRARFIEPLLAGHDRKRFEVSCYSDAGRPDELTAKFRGMADLWRETVGMSDEAVAEQIQGDGIDLLVDCTGHMAHNRMLMLARRVAPIQVLYPGYPDTSGLKTVDYWISDAYQDPPGLTDPFRTEKVIRLDPFARCYTPSDNSPAPGPLPMLSNGFITFGAMNNPVKNNAKVLALWSRLMAAVPTARLLVLIGAGAEKAIIAAFDRHGIPTSRLEIVTRAPREKYLELFGRIDILLDPFPYNGYTTTLDSLWMGVPVLTVAGNTNISRAGVSLLSNAGLPEWIAESPDEYLKLAIQFAGDATPLSELRGRLRQQMQASPLMDAAGFIQKMEAAYRMMWKTWCQARPS